MHLRMSRIGLLPVLLLSAALLGCPKEQPAAPSSSGSAPNAASSGNGGQKPKIAVIPKGTSHSFWLTVKAGAEAAGAEEGADIIWVGPAKETDITDQINIVQNQVSSGVNGIVLAATDSNALIKPVQDAMAKGVPVVTVDSGLSQPISLCYIATDNVKGGQEAADALAKAVGEKGKVGLLAFLKGAASSDEREKGFLDGMKKHPNITVLPPLYTDSDAEKATDQSINMLTANPDVAGIFAANEPNGVGAASALKSRKLESKVKLVAFDASDDEIRALQDGTIQALIVQDPFKMGYLGVKTVLQAIRKQPIPDKRIDSGVTVVTKENMNTPDVQKLLHPTK